MNILFVSSDNDLYHGAFLSMVKLASTLRDKHGHNVIIALPYEGDGVKLLHKSNLRYKVIPSRDWVIELSEKKSIIRITKEAIKYLLNKKAVYQLRRLINEERIDIVHINTSWTYVGAVAALKEKKTLIWHIREFLEEDQHLCIWCKSYGYNLMKKANTIIAISTSLYDKYTDLLSTNNIVLINNGINPERFYDPNHIIMVNNNLRFVIVGSIIDWKRQKEAVLACIRLQKSGFNDFVFEVVGDDSSEYAQEIKALVQKNHAEKNIFFMGNQSHPEEFYKKADVTFMCSASEAFGRVTVEAMMGGSLVIGAKAAGTLDIINDKETGLLYNSGDDEDLYNKIVFAIANPEKVRSIAEKGRTEMMQRMTSDINADSINNLYSRISG